MLKIDIVYTWCNGNDPAFIKLKNDTLEAENIQSELYPANQRYQNNNELMYSLRSVEKYAPWVNHIYIVTNNQRPEWFKETEKITIVDHSQIIPEDKRPTFNSICIENYIVNIPGLSDLFLYFNDDLFLNKKIKPEDFFFGGKPVVRFSKPCIGNFYEPAKPYPKTIFNSYLKVLSKNRFYFPLAYPTHGVDAYSKELIREINKKYPEIEELNTTKFRTITMLQRVIYSYEMAYVFGCQHKIYQVWGNRLKKIFHILFPKDYFFNVDYQAQHSHGSLKKHLLLIKLYKPICFCFNDVTEPAEMIEYLEKRFPQKASCE